MKTLLIALSMALAGVTLNFAPTDAEARRLGGGRAAGMQRQMPPKQADVAPKPSPGATAAAPAAAGAAATAGRRSFMGPLAGLAAGLGIAALLSHFGFGEGLANFVTLLLLAAVAFIAIRWLMRRLNVGAPTARAAPGNLQFAGAGAPRGGPGAEEPEPMQRSALATPAVAAGSAVDSRISAVQPAGFDAAEFERIAKMIFIRLQAANDAAEVDDLRRFTTPELFASLRLDLQERGPAAQKTDVVQLEAEVLDTAQEDGQWVVSVRFHGLIREDAGGTAEPFDELWHLVKPVQGEREWAIAGISPTPT
ncbi:Tim44 domain-containing protein [Methylibium sp.]|uniref:Tim44 domain-containing protein n=1 Tax=Methylibium sp. TaxID=2067992 RepID=UPI0017B9F4A4|nr:Tim44-like domain-containing protein [Methylibium sp.]MBA3590911.1 Tim44 domain-containing protein [Methylibium sp.]